MQSDLKRAFEEAIRALKVISAEKDDHWSYHCAKMYLDKINAILGSPKGKDVSKVVPADEEIYP
jgi:hypothetical protein